MRSLQILVVSLSVIILHGADVLAKDATPLIGIVSEKPTSGHFVEIDGGYMVPYQAKIPGTDITYTMTPIPGGTFKMGSAARHRYPRNEQPKVEIEVEPFWMSVYELTWAEYKTYMALHDQLKRFQQQGLLEVNEKNRVDAFTTPSNLYDPTFTFQSGSDPRQPALSMSQYAAKQFTKWLSLTRGRFYRLPTEAEWEYAARAGSNSDYSFGDDERELSDYAWYASNSDDRPHLVGKKKPNAWGLYDMHGNVAEWVIDAYSKDYRHLKGKTSTVKEAIQWPTELYPRVVRGGAFSDRAEILRSAFRVESNDEDWQADDPCFPMSPWWYTSDYGLSVGFRIVRPLTTPTRENRERFWAPDHDQLKENIKIRIDDEGRGARGPASPELPATLKKPLDD